MANDEILLLIQDYLAHNGLQDALLALERQTGVRLRSYGPELDFFRQLVVDGQWDDAERFVAALWSRPHFDHRRVRFLLRRQRFLEQVAGCDLGRAVLELVESLKELEDSCPPDEFQSLCYCLTLKKITDHPDLTDWTEARSRLQTFERCLEQFGAIYPAQIARRHGLVEPNRLLHLLKQAVLYQLSTAAVQDGFEVKPGRRSYPLLHDIDFGRHRWSSSSTPGHRQYGVVASVIDPSHALRSVRFSPDGRRIAMGSASGTLRLCSADDDMLPIEARFDAHHDNAIYSIDWSDDGRLLATGAGDDRIRVLNLDTGAVWSGAHAGPVRSVVFVEGDGVASAGAGDFLVRIWDRNGGAGERQTLAGHTDVIVAMATRAGVLISASYDGVLNQWDGQRQGQRVAHLITDPIMSCALSSDARTVFMAHTTGAYSAWDLSSQRPLWRRPSPRPASGRALSLTADDRLLLTASDDGAVHVVDAGDGDLLQTMTKGHADAVLQAQWDPTTPTRFATCSRDRTAALWRYPLENGEHY